MRHSEKFVNLGLRGACHVHRVRGAPRRAGFQPERHARVCASASASPGPFVKGLHDMSQRDSVIHLIAGG